MSPAARAPDGDLPAAVDAVVVGAGLGGLTAALELSRRGLSVLVLEQHRVPGGYAHSFKRGGFTFDVSLHMMGGLGRGHVTHGVLASLGVMDKLLAEPRERLFVAAHGGHEVALPSGRAALTERLGQLFPAERAGIVALFTHLETLKRHVIGPWVDPEFNVPPEQRLVAQYAGKTLGELFAEHVRDPHLLALLGQLWMSIGLPPSLSSATFSTCVLGSYLLEGAYLLDGGGAALSRAMVARLEELGGRCVTSARVSRIRVEAGRAMGVELESGGFVGAQVVISGANPYQTFFELIPGAEVSQVYRQRLRAMQPSLSFYALYLGLDCVPSALGIPSGSYCFNHALDYDVAYQQILAGDTARTDWVLTSYEGSGAAVAPAGGGVVSVVELTPAGDWLNLDEATYRERKAQLQAALLAKYNARFEGLSSHAVVVELGTPRTMVRYTSNHQGAVYGLAQTVQQSANRRLGNRAPIPGLYLTGAWTYAGGGYEGAIMSGVQTADAVLKHLEVNSNAPPIDWRCSTTTALPESERAADAHYQYRLRARVYGDDVGSTGRASATAYLRFLDRGRVEAIEAACRQSSAESWLERYVVNVYRMSVAVQERAALGERLVVRSGVRRVSTHRAAFDQQICSADSGRLLVDAVVEIAFLDEARQLAPVPIASCRTERPAPLVGAQPAIPPVAFGRDDHYPRRFPVRVYYEDTDEQGIAYHVSYVRFIGQASFELLAALEPGLLDVAKACIRRLEIRYLSAARLGDWLEVRVGARLIGENLLVLDHRIVHTGSGQVLADAAVELGLHAAGQGPTPIPDSARGAVLALLTAHMG